MVHNSNLTDITGTFGYFDNNSVINNLTNALVEANNSTVLNGSSLVLNVSNSNISNLTGSVVFGTSLAIDGTLDPTMDGAIIAGNGAVDARISYVGNDSWLNVAGGSLGVGTNTPGFKLDVASSLVGYSAAFSNTNDAAGSNGVQITAGENAFSTGSDLITFKRPDGTIIGSVNQNSSTTVAFNITSDERLKENITNTHYNLDTILSLSIKDYSYVTDSNKTIVTGLLAQELYKLFPGAVTVGNDEVDINGNLVHPWQVDYSKLSPLALKGIQDLNTKLESAVLEQNGKLDAVNTQMAIQGITITTLGDDLIALGKRVDLHDSEIQELRDELKTLKDKINLQTAPNSNTDTISPGDLRN